MSSIALKLTKVVTGRDVKVPYVSISLQNKEKKLAQDEPYTALRNKSALISITPRFPTQHCSWKFPGIVGLSFW
jgi:hypothetical protein